MKISLAKMFILLMLLGTLVYVFNTPPVYSAKPCAGCYCSVTATDLNFGSYDSLTQLAVDSAGDIEVVCGTDTIGDVMSYNIEISDSNRGSTPREMIGPGAYILYYNIYTTAARTTIWGDNTGSTVRVVDSYTFTTLCCETRNYTTYGRINAGQNVAPGSYNDPLIVTVNY